MDSLSTKDYSYTQNRELSWLRFNERVLEEALDDTVPLYERFKFISIFTSNLDEFYMIRVGSLTDISLVQNDTIDSKSGMTPSEQLERIHRETQRLTKRRDRIFQALEPALTEYSFTRLTEATLSGSDRKSIDSYYRSYVRPVLSPQIIGTHHPFPHIENLQIHLVVRLQKNDSIIFGIVPVPKMLPRVYFTDDQESRYILMEDLILLHLEEIFDQFQVLDKSVIVVTRNADINTEEGLLDEDIDYRAFMKKILKKRSRLAPVRLEYSTGMAKHTLQFLQQQLGLSQKNSFRLESPIDMSYVFTLENRLPRQQTRTLLYMPHKPRTIVPLAPGESVTALVNRQDVLLYYPFEDIDLFLQLVKESAENPHVISIHITVYRLARNSRLVEYLVKAAESGKEVVVLMELRARFDEENNINWSETLIEAGCKVFYGFDDYKTHSKVCLITAIEDNQLHHITQIGTGNYNESTSRLYTDLSLITANQTIGQDANHFFKDMLIGVPDGRYHDLIASPFTLKERVIEHIDEQIDLARRGKEASMTFKLNSMTDRELIDKLAEASQAGVQIDMIIRGICCLLPGVPGKTENIRIRSIVGRFLEHARVYAFGRGETANVYISSADFMTRNTEKRIEIAAPIKDPACKEKIFGILDEQLRDNVKARIMQPDGTYLPIETDEPPFSTQAHEMLKAKRAETEWKEKLQEEKALTEQKEAPATAPPAKPEGFWDKIRRMFER